MYMYIAETHGCVFVENETHESGVTKPGVHLVANKTHE